MLQVINLKQQKFEICSDSFETNIEGAAADENLQTRSTCDSSFSVVLRQGNDTMVSFTNKFLKIS